MTDRKHVVDCPRCGLRVAVQGAQVAGSTVRGYLSTHASDGGPSGGGVEECDASRTNVRVAANAEVTP